MRTHAIIMRAHAMTNAYPRNDQCVSPKKLMRGHAKIMRGHAIIMRGHAIIMRAHTIIMRAHAILMRVHAIVSTWPAACETPLES